MVARPTQYLAQSLSGAAHDSVGVPEWPSILQPFGNTRICAADRIAVAEEPSLKFFDRYPIEHKKQAAVVWR